MDTIVPEGVQETVIDYVEHLIAEHANQVKKSTTNLPISNQFPPFFVYPSFQRDFLHFLYQKKILVYT